MSTRFLSLPVLITPAREVHLRFKSGRAVPSYYPPMFPKDEFYYFYFLSAFKWLRSVETRQTPHWPSEKGWCYQAGMLCGFHKPPGWHEEKGTSPSGVVTLKPHHPDWLWGKHQTSLDWGMLYTTPGQHSSTLSGSWKARKEWATLSQTKETGELCQLKPWGTLHWILVQKEKWKNWKNPDEIWSLVNTCF